MLSIIAQTKEQQIPQDEKEKSKNQITEKLPATGKAKFPELS